MEFITDITLIVDEADYKDPRRLMKFLQLYSPEKKGGCYKVRGTFEEVEELSIKLSALRHLSPVTRGGVCLQDEEDPVHVRAVGVSSVVMAYIVQKCAEKFNKIKDNAFVTVTHSQLRTVNNKQSVTEQVIFRPRRISMNRVHVDLVRQQFITFYQRTASDLQVTSVPLSPHEYRDLQKKFPQVLFKPSHSGCEVTATGPFVHIAQLKKFLSQNTQSSSGSPVNRGPVNTASRETSDSSAACRKDPEDESCPICMEPIETSDRETLPCKHSFCTNCLKKAFDYKPVCPTCGELYGMLTGTQPEGGKMNISKTSTSLPGYEQYGTIIIRYNVPSGIQKVEHPNPGQPYEGVSRTAYLPNSSEGQRILRLLQRAFDQRLVFTVGRSTTSGRSNVVTWNDIHHKTSTHGGPTQYGYPDPDYLRRVRDELAVKGIK